MTDIDNSVARVSTKKPKGASLEDSFGSDAGAQAEGKWVDLQGGKILIAFAGEDNPRYEKALNKYTDDFRMQMMSDHMHLSQQSEPKVKKAMRQTYAEAVVLNWENIFDKEGNLIPFSTKAVFDAFERMPAFFRWVREYAGSLENYKVKSEEVDSKNS